MTELLRALGALTESPAPEHARIAGLLGLPGPPEPAAHTELFGMQLYPYASFYLGAEGMLGGAARDRIAGFWRAVGHTPPAEPDHLAALLGLQAALTETETAEGDDARRRLLRQARHALLWEHLLPWLVLYLTRLAELADPAHRAWGELLARALEAEAEALGPPAGASAHFRAAAPPGAPADGGLDELLGALLTPIRSGLILTRADLARAGQQLDVGLRLSERRVALRQLLTHEPERVLAWISAEARRQAARLRDGPPAFRSIADFWVGRAEATAALLEAGAAAVPANE